MLFLLVITFTNTDTCFHSSTYICRVTGKLLIVKPCFNVVNSEFSKVLVTAFRSVPFNSKHPTLTTMIISYIIVAQLFRGHCNNHKKGRGVGIANLIGLLNLS